MRFWLKWAIVTLPVVICVFLWARSYWVEERLSYLKNGDYTTVGSNHGCFGFSRYGPVTGREGWLWFSDQAKRGPWISETFLGFGFEHRSNKRFPESETTIQLPWWAATLLAGVPPFWLYRRQRKRRRKGFPIEPVGASSKESTQAQTV